MRQLPASVKVGGLVVGSRLLGLVRDGLLAKYLGSGWISDAYFTAFRIPNMLRDLLGEGALSSIVVSKLGQMEQSRPEQIKSFIRKLIGFWGLAFFLITLLGILFAPWIVQVLAQGFKDNPEQFQMTIDLTRCIFPYMGLVGLCAMSMGILHHKKVFGWATSASIFFNATCILSMVGYAYYKGQTDPLSMVYVVAVSIVFGGLVQWLCLWPSLLKKDVSLLPLFDFKDSEVIDVLKKLGPAVLSVAAVQINVAVNGVFATFLGEGGATSVSFAFRLMQLPVGIVGVSVATVLLPKLSEHVAKKDGVAFGQDIGSALGKVTFLTFPAVLGLFAIGPELVGALYERGNFHSEDSLMVWIALQGYLIGILPYALHKNLMQGFFAHSDTKFPVYVSFLSIVINFLLNYTLVFVFEKGVWGLTFGTSVVLTLNCLIIYLGLFFKYHLRFKVGLLLKTWCLQLLCAGMMFLSVFYLKQSVTLNWVVFDVGLYAGVGGAVYLGLVFLLKKTLKIKLF